MLKGANRREHQVADETVVVDERLPRLELRNDSEVDQCEFALRLEGLIPREALLHGPSYAVAQFDADIFRFDITVNNTWDL